MAPNIQLSRKVLLTLLLTVPISLSINASIFDKAKDAWDDVKDAGESIVKAGIKATTAPYEAILATGNVIVTQESPESVLEPYKQVVISTATATEKVNLLADAPRRMLYQAANEVVSELGDEASFVFDLATFSQQFFSGLGNSGITTITNILRGSNPLELIAAPLAAAIRAAREKHLANSRPLPKDVKAGLAGIFPDSTLERARYAIGNVEITLPNFIGQGSKFLEKDTAVVVDDIIVFPIDPGSFQDSTFWWVHEVAHVNQYRVFGVDQFAYKYAKDLGRSIEEQADQKATSVSSTKRPRSARRPVRQLGVKVSIPTGGLGVGTDTPDSDEFVAQCFFPQDPRLFNFMITDMGKIIAVNAASGEYAQYGWATRSAYPGVAWYYTTATFYYAVDHSGAVMYGPGNQVGQCNLLE